LRTAERNFHIYDPCDFYGTSNIIQGDKTECEEGMADDMALAEKLRVTQMKVHIKG
jgi:hypothetical protein